MPFDQLEALDPDGFVTVAEIAAKQPKQHRIE